MFTLLSFCSFPWWLAWLLPFLLGLLAGWAIWSRYKSQYDELYGDYEASQREVARLQSELDQCVKNSSTQESHFEKIKRELREKENELLAYRKQNNQGPSKEVHEKMKADILDWKAKYEKLDTLSIATKADRDDWKTKYESLKAQNANNTELEELKVRYNAEVHKSKTLSQDMADLKSRYTEVDKKIKTAEDEATGWKIKYNALKADEGSSSISAAAGFAAGAISRKASQSTPKALIYAQIAKDNLQIVEGIGPKMESVLKEHGIHTYSELGTSTTSHIQEILGKYGDKYRIIDPSTWVQQAKLAHEDQWEELIQLQKRLDAGKDNATHETDSKLEKLMIKMGLIKKWKKDDLTAIEGIGPAISKLLNDNGITTWRHLADAKLDHLKSILEGAGSRFGLADPETWAQQADLADKGEFDKLVAFQDLLDGGRTK